MRTSDLIRWIGFCWLTCGCMATVIASPSISADLCQKPVSTREDPCLHQPTDTQCTECHLQTSQTHAHDILILPDRFPPPKSWPTQQNQVSCITCHDVLNQKKVGKLDPDNLDALRGGPYASFSDFCFNCHEPLKKELKKLNPHLSMVDAQGKIQLEACADCHSMHVTSTQTKITPQDLKLPATLICLSCHKKTQHVGSVAHVDKKLTPSMMDHLKTFETETHKKIPLTNENRVSCASCHHSHPPAVIKLFHIPTLLRTQVQPSQPPSALSQELWAFHKDQVALRLTEGRFTLIKAEDRKLPLQAQVPQLCQACH